MRWFEKKSAIFTMLLTLWLIEPFVYEWFFKTECSFGSLSKEEYAPIRNRAQKLSSDWDWGKTVPKHRPIALPAQSRMWGGRHLIAFLDANFVNFVPKSASDDVKVAHVLAFMEALGARLYRIIPAGGQGAYKPSLHLRYVIYKMRVNEYDLTLLAPKSRYLKLHVALKPGLPGNSIIKRYQVRPTGLIDAPLDDNKLELFTPLGCVDHNLIVKWGL